MRAKHGLTSILSRAGVFAALILILTAFTQIPLATGYIHFGDALIFVACVYIGWAAVPAAAVGSALADLITPYAIYAVPTFIIKGTMAALAVLIFKSFRKFSKNADCKIRTADCGLQNAGYKTRTADSGLQNADCEIWTVDNGLQNTDCKIRTADSGLQNTDLRPEARNADTPRAEQGGAERPEPKKRGRNIPSVWLMLAAFAVASLFMQCAYALTDYLLYGVIGDAGYTFVFVEFLRGFIQSAFGIPLGVVSSRLLKRLPANFFL
ncbi:MAG: ECF transporter S component [Clostridiales bacterium]|jgi:uncharacterized membrane protein|nr:ECF transporter S component [Clostridiales bacterium]